MIIDSIMGYERYLNAHPNFAKAFKFLRSNDLDKLEAGAYEIDGRNVYAIVSEGEGTSIEDAKLEVHDSYIDIQLLVSGSETLGWKDRARCEVGNSMYDELNDCAEYDDEPEVFFMLEPMNFAIFYPHDAHLAMVGNGAIKKVVVKVKL